MEPDPPTATHKRHPRHEQTFGGVPFSRLFADFWNEFFASLVYFTLTFSIRSNGIPKTTAHAFIAAAVVLKMIVFRSAACHPYISFVRLVRGKIYFTQFLVILIGQIIGALLAGVLAYLAFYLSFDLALPHLGTIPPLFTPFPVWSAFAQELFGCIIVLIVYIIEDSIECNAILRHIIISFFVGLSYLPLAGAFGPVTGAIFNPWSALVPELYLWKWTDAWIWQVAPLVAILPALLVSWILNLSGLFAALSATSLPPLTDATKAQ